MLTDNQLKRITSEFEAQNVPRSFAGAVVRSSLYEGIYYHVKPDGTLGKIEERTPDGSSYKYNPA